LAQRRKANHKYQACFAARLDHAERQRAYYRRRKLKLQKLTGQGSKSATASVTIDLALVGVGGPTKSTDQSAAEAPHARSKSLPAGQQASFQLVCCTVCGRSALWAGWFPRLP
jgi:hypothetical protein